MIEYSNEQIVQILNQDVERMEKNGDTIILYMIDGTKIWAIIKYIKTVKEQKEDLDDEIRILNYNLETKNTELNNLITTYNIVEKEIVELTSSSEIIEG